MRKKAEWGLMSYGPKQGPWGEGRACDFGRTILAANDPADLHRLESERAIKMKKRE